MDSLYFFPVCLFFLVISIFINIYLIIHLKSKSKQKNMSVEAQQLLASLLTSSAMLRIQVLDPGDFFLKSPRGRY